MKANQSKGLIMTLSVYAIALAAVLFLGYLLAVSLGTWAYFSNEKNY